MPTKLGIFFLGMTIGGATFLATGLAAFLTISQIQYGTLQARATRVTEIDQVSVRAKDIPVVIGTEADVRYAQLPPE